MEKRGYVYILTNFQNTTLYVGVTSNLSQRIDQHRSGVVPGFTKKYDLKKLVYAEAYDTITEAIYREKRLKAGSRAKKIKMIESENPNWEDISRRLA